MGSTMGLVVASLQPFGFGGRVAAPSVPVVAPEIGTAWPPAGQVAGNHTASFQTLRNAVGGRRVGGRFCQHADRSRHGERRTAAWFKPSPTSQFLRLGLLGQGERRWN